LRVSEVHQFTDAPNAETTGIEPSTTIILPGHPLYDDFSRLEVRLSSPKRSAHVAHDDVLHRIGWFALFLFPALGFALTCRRQVLLLPAGDQEPQRPNPSFWMNTLYGNHPNDDGADCDN